MATTTGAQKSLPRVVIAGLGPADAGFVPPATTAAVAASARCLVRTERHPAVAAVTALARCPVEYLDHHYESADTFDEVYRAIVEDVVAAATAAASEGSVCYLVPGSPLVAERTVELLRADDRVTTDVIPALSFLDLAWERLHVDPVAVGVRIVDAATFAVDVAGQRGPFLVAQCHSRAVLSTLKLALDVPAGVGLEPQAVLLHHLGLVDESVTEVPWADIDRTIEADHLTSLWVARLAVPAAAEMVQLEELVRTLRARCPWDMSQTHGSLGRHLLEEAYEALDAIEALSQSEPDVPSDVVDHLEEELGDVLFQVYFHSVLAAEEGRFTLADVARTVHDKLVARHPHVFGDAVAETPEAVAQRWEVLKKAEKGRTSVTEGIPSALPALALAAKLQRKAESVGMTSPGLAARLRELEAGLAEAELAEAGLAEAELAEAELAELAEAELAEAEVAEAGQATGDRATGETLGGSPRTVAALGGLLFALADVARLLGVDPESALRARAVRFRIEIEETESR